jgi:hypothetical protein
MRVKSKGRTRENVSREQTLRLMGYREDQHWESPPCRECGFDRRYRGNQICAFCGCNNPSPKRD